MAKGLSAQSGSIFEIATGLDCDSHRLNALVAARTDFFRKTMMLGERGDGALRVALFATSTISFFVDLFALQNVRAVPFILSSDLVLAERARLLEAIAPDWLIDGSGNEPLVGAGGPRAPIPIDTAMMLFTSGSTAFPKTVIHRFENLLARLRAGDRAIPPNERRVTLSVLPLHFAHGLISVGLQTLFSGGRLVLAPKLSLESAPEIGNWIDKFDVEYVSGTPSSWDLAVRMSHPPVKGTLRRAHIASAHARRGLLPEIISWTGTHLYNSYGSTETASWVSCLEVPSSVDPADVSIGTGESFGSEFKLNSGELLIRSPALFAGYWGEWTPETKPIEWYATGDLAKENIDGSYTLVGRLGRVINRAGLKISPEQIELVLGASPLIADAAVAGITSDLGVERIGAAIVLRVGIVDAEAMPQIKRYLEENLSPSHIPTDWKFVSKIPRRPNGKPDLQEIGLLWKA